MVINEDERVEPIILHEDNKACIAFSKNPGDHKRSKDIELRYIKTTDQVADIFTKALARDQFIILRWQLMGC